MSTMALRSVVALCVVLILAAPALAFPSYAAMGRRTHPNRITFAQTHEEAVGASIKSTYVSEPMPLARGEVVFTDPSLTILQFPPGRIAIHGFFAEIVDENNVSVPLSEAYLHHWLVFGPPNGGVCGGYLAYSFGVGAESRLTPVLYPEPYALVVQGNESWGANIHVMRTVDLDPQYGVKGCIECLYAPGKGCSPEQNGMFACCQDGSRCPVVASAPTDVKNYYLRYTVTWRAVEPTTVPVTIFVLDASACQIEYNIYPQPGNVAVTTLDYTVPFDSKMVFGVGHLHEAGYNITLFHSSNGGPSKAVCTSIPKYGTQVGVAGNELGYVVGISACSFAEPYSVRAGDKLTLTSFYNVGPSDPRTWNTGMHGGVMSLFYVVSVAA